MDISAIGRQLGLNEEQTRAAFEALTPVVAAGVRRSAQSPDALQDILKTVLAGSAQADSENPLGAAKTTGNEILGQIFGSKDTSREVAQQLSATSGVGAAVLKQLLPIIASIVMGQMAKKMGGGATSSGGGLGDILGDILGGGAQQQPQSGGAGGGLGDILGDILGGGQAAQPRGGAGGGGLGDILGDILGGGQAQQPRGGAGGGGLGDILGDILGGGQQQPEMQQRAPQGQGGSLDDILGDLLGGEARKGGAGDVLLDSVDKALRRR